MVSQTEQRVGDPVTLLYQKPAQDTLSVSWELAEVRTGVFECKGTVWYRVHRMQFFTAGLTVRSSFVRADMAPMDCSVPSATHTYRYGSSVPFSYSHLRHLPSNLHDISNTKLNLLVESVLQNTAQPLPAEIQNHTEKIRDLS